MTAVQEVLAAWRDAERLLDELPPVGTDHETVVLTVASLRAAYARLTTEPIPTTPEILAQTHEAIDRSRELLRRVREQQRGVISH